jgi:hypothetical protein
MHSALLLAASFARDTPWSLDPDAMRGAPQPMRRNCCDASRPPTVPGSSGCCAIVPR